MRYVLDVNRGWDKTAGLKAKLDVTKSLSEDGFVVIPNIKMTNKRIKVLFVGHSHWRKLLPDLKAGDTVVYQYPFTDNGRILDFFLLARVKKKKAKKVLLIHDVESIRFFKNYPKKIKKEINFFNQFDKIIAHNNKMIDWLRKNGVSKELISLDIFDYINESPMITDLNKNIAFTGNLGKSPFLKSLNCKTKVSLYGILPDKYNENINYKGSFSPEMLGYEIKETFGLVWDGDSIDTCSGMNGEYLRFNNPHKVSFYLSMGMPVIIWKEAAMAEFIEKNQCGILIDNLKNLDTIMGNLDEEEIKRMKKNAEIIGKEIRSGSHIKKAVEKSN